MLIIERVYFRYDQAIVVISILLAPAHSSKLKRQSISLWKAFSVCLLLLLPFQHCRYIINKKKTFFRRIFSRNSGVFWPNAHKLCNIAVHLLILRITIRKNEHTSCTLNAWIVEAPKVVEQQAKKSFLMYQIRTLQRADSHRNEKKYVCEFVWNYQ